MDDTNKRSSGFRKNDLDNPNFEQVFTDAEDTFRRGLETLTQWSDQARNVIQNRPGVVLASLSIAGFMTGIMLRRGTMSLRGERQSLPADPMIVFLTGAFAGLTLGPRVLREVAQSGEQRGPRGDETSSEEPFRH